MIKVTMPGGEEYDFNCYKILLRTDGNVTFITEFDYTSGPEYPKLPKRYVTKIKKDYFLILYFFAGNKESAESYAKRERRERLNRGRWISYIDTLKKEFLVECLEA